MDKIKEQWKDTDFLSQNLTLKDMEDLLEYIAPWLKTMEIKFSWDYSVNHLGLSVFIDYAMGKMYEIVNKEYKSDDELYPKQRDFDSLWDIIAEYNITGSIGENDNIWERTRDEIFKISKELLN